MTHNLPSSPRWGHPPLPCGPPVPDVVGRTIPTSRWSILMARLRTTLLATLALVSLGAGVSQAHQANAGPLFGLEGAPDGSLLVADTGSGIVSMRGDRHLTIPLPGVTDVSSVGTGLLWATRTGENPVEDSGQALVRVRGKQTTVVANLFAFEEENDPDGQGVDSNPFDVQALSGRAALVVDAGANALLRVDKHGHIDVVATFPNDQLSTSNLKELAGCPDAPPEAAAFCEFPDTIEGQAVPTSVVIGPDGWYWVGELKGFPAPTGQSRIWRIHPDATDVECGSSPDCELVFDGGFTSIIDLAVGPDGNLWVAELDEASWVAVEILQSPTGGSVNRCDPATGTCDEVATGLDVLSAIAFDKDGQLWAVVNALTPGGAELVRIP